MYVSNVAMMICGMRYARCDWYAEVAGGWGPQYTRVLPEDFRVKKRYQNEDLFRILMLGIEGLDSSCEESEIRLSCKNRNQCPGGCVACS